MENERNRQSERKRNSIVKLNSNLHKLDPFIDKEDLLRVGGRLRSTTSPYEIKHPVIAPKKSHVIGLLIRQFLGDSLARGPIFPRMARVSSVRKLFMAWFVIVKCNACFSFCIKSFQIFRIIKLPRRMFVFFTHLRNLDKLSIFSAFPGSFAPKNDNIHFFFAILVAILEFAGFPSKQECFHGNGPYCYIPTEKEQIRAHRFA